MMGWERLCPYHHPPARAAEGSGACLPQVQLGIHFPIILFLKAVGTMTILYSATFGVE